MKEFFLALCLQLIASRLTGERAYYNIIMNGWLLFAFGYPLYECLVKPAFEKKLWKLKMEKSYNQLPPNDEAAADEWYFNRDRSWTLMIDDININRVKCFKKLIDEHLACALSHIGSCMMIELFFADMSYEEIYQYGTIIIFVLWLYKELKSIIK